MLETPDRSFFIVAKEGLFFEDCSGECLTRQLEEACKLRSYIAVISLAVEKEGTVIKVFPDGAQREIISFEHPTAHR
jgi:hypothetical protein